MGLKKPPIAFVPNCAKRWAHIRETNMEHWQEIINSVDKYTFLQFGISETMSKFENVITIPDLNVKQLKAMYRVIGKYILNATLDKDGYEAKNAIITLHIIERVSDDGGGGGGGGGLPIGGGGRSPKSSWRRSFPNGWLRGKILFWCDFQVTPAWFDS